MSEWDFITPAELAAVKAKFPVSKDVEKLSLGGGTVPKTTGLTDGSGESSPAQPTPAQGINQQRTANGTTHLRSASAKARGKANLLNPDPGQDAKLERHSGNGAVGALPVQARLGQRFLVRVTSIRQRLLDEDNLCEKYHVDLCRYAGVLPKDSPGTAKIETGEQKVEPGFPEETLIEIFEI